MYSNPKSKSASSFTHKGFFNNSLFSQIPFASSLDSDNGKVPIVCLTVSNDKLYLAAEEFNGKIYVWNIFNRECVYIYDRHLSSEITFLTDSHHLISCTWDILEIHDFKKRECKTISGNFLNSHSQKNTISKMSLASLPNNEVAVIKWSGEKRNNVSIGILNTETYKWIKTLDHENVACIKTLANNRLLSFSYPNTIKLWDLKTYKEIKTIEFPDWNNQEDVRLSINELASDKVLFCFSKDEGTDAKDCSSLALDLSSGKIIVGKLPFPNMRDVFEFDHETIVVSEYPNSKEEGNLRFIRVNIDDKSINFNEVTTLTTQYGVSAFAKLKENSFICGFLLELCTLYKIEKTLFNQIPTHFEDLTFTT